MIVVMTPGCLFVVHGDLLEISSDAWLLPGDSGWNIRDPWRGKIAPWRNDKWADGGKRVSEKLSNGDALEGRIIRIINSGADNQEDPAWLADGLNTAMQWFEDDLENLFSRSSPSGRQSRNGRVRPLLTMPLIGVGAGGYSEIRGEAISAVLTGLQEQVQSASFDVAIVCFRRSDFAAVQSQRRATRLCRLTEADELLAKNLGNLAADGRLVPFIGAGVSVGAGLPSWESMLIGIEEAISPTHSQAGDQFWGKIDELDRAAVLERKVDGPTFNELIKDQVTASAGYSLAHALLASLRAPEVVTTNYDDLFELSGIASDG